ncbi:MAG: MBL fold metallo-hydrolase [Candidatus Paceibacterota bacterium]
MVITYSGLSFVRLSFGNLVIGINPIAKSHTIKTSRFGADIAMTSLNTEAFNGVSELSFGNKETFVIDGPGEYEYSEVFIKGYPSTGPYGQINTIYSFLLEGMQVVCLGALALKELPPDVLEELSGADILFVPVGDEGTLDGKASAKLATSLEPKIVIPVLYGEDVKSDFMKDFLLEIGGEAGPAVDKLSLKKKDLEGKTIEPALLTVSK